MHLPENLWAQLIWECLSQNDGQPKQRPKWTKLLHSHWQFVWPMGKRNLKLSTRENWKIEKKSYKVWEVAGHFELFEGRGQ